MKKLNIVSVQYIMVIVLIAISYIMVQKSEEYMSNTYNSYMYFVVRYFIYITLGIIISIPKMVKFNKFKINFYYVILELILILGSLAVLLHYNNFLGFRLICFSIGYFLINCIKTMAEEV